MEEKRKPALLVYDIFIIILAIVSIVLTILDLCGKVDSTQPAFFIADNSILIIFAVDYVVRFIFAKKKWDFFKHNIFDLLAIIPFNSLFTFFRFARLFRLMKFARLLKFTKFARVIGVFGKMQKRLDKFLRTNGFIYMLYAAGALILISSVLMSYIEKQSFTDALWWSIVTCTTVGYGDISPSTGVGRVIAVILMIFGIGFISMLTGTITTFFTEKITPTDEPKDKTLDEMLAELSDEERDKVSEIIKILHK